MSDSPCTLLQFLRGFPLCRATDPRDKIYCIIGIATPYPNITLPIDYTIEWPEVFLRATKYVIEGENSLNILTSSGSGREELPSWVPDYTQPYYPNCSSIGRDRSKHHNRAREGNPPTAQFSSDGTCLTVDVIFVDALDYNVPPELDGDGVDVDVLKALKGRLGLILVHLLHVDRNPGFMASLPELVLEMIIAYASVRLYQATYFPPRAKQVWPLETFVKLCIRLRMESDELPHFTSEQLDVLRNALSLEYFWFSCGLNSYSLLLEDLQAAAILPPNTLPEIVAALGHCKFPVFGECPNAQASFEEGDMVAIVLGCDIPLILRPMSLVGPSGELQLRMRVIGEAYVDGIMDGEALGKCPVERITLV